MTEVSTNGISPELAQNHMGKILGIYEELNAQKIRNMNECRDIRARLPGLYESAKAEGLPIRAFKWSVKKRLIELKIKDLRENVEHVLPEDTDEDDAAAYDMLQQALGDFGGTPLGAATLDAAADKREKAAARKAAKVSRDQAAADPTAVQAAADAALVAQNTERLEAGIKPLSEGDKPTGEVFEDDHAAVETKPSRRAQRAAKLDDLSTAH